LRRALPLTGVRWDACLFGERRAVDCPVSHTRGGRSLGHTQTPPGFGPSPGFMAFRVVLTWSDPHYARWTEPSNLRSLSSAVLCYAVRVDHHVQLLFVHGIPNRSTCEVCVGT